MTLTLPRPMEAHLTSSTKRSRAVPTGAPTTEIRKFLDQQRAARAYAEAWHKALRAWQVRVPVILRPTLPYSSGRFEGTTTLGEFLPDQKTALVTPMGEVGEVEVGSAITLMQLSTVPDLIVIGSLLDRYRRQLPTPASLTDPRGGWAYPRARSAAYAVACLTLAGRLGDRQTELPAYIQACRLAVGVEPVAQIPT